VFDIRGDRLLWCADAVPPEIAKKMPKKPYAKAGITNSADKRIRKELDDADDILEKVIYRQLLNFMLSNIFRIFCLNYLTVVIL